MAVDGPDNADPLSRETLFVSRFASDLENFTKLSDRIKKKWLLFQDKKTHPILNNLHSYIALIYLFYTPLFHDINMAILAFSLYQISMYSYIYKKKSKSKNISHTLLCHTLDFLFLYIYSLWTIKSNNSLDRSNQGENRYWLN